MLLRSDSTILSRMNSAIALFASLSARLFCTIVWAPLFVIIKCLLATGSVLAFVFVATKLLLMDLDEGLKKSLGSNLITGLYSSRDTREKASAHLAADAFSHFRSSVP